MSFQKGDLIKVTDNKMPLDLRDPNPSSGFTYWKIGQKACVVEVISNRGKHNIYSCKIVDNTDISMPESQLLREGQMQLIARTAKSTTTVNLQDSDITCTVQNSARLTVAATSTARCLSSVSLPVSSPKEQKPMSLKIIQVLESNNVELSKLSVSQVAEAIKKQQSEIDALTAVTPKTKSMSKRIDVLKAELDAFVQAVDAL